MIFSTDDAKEFVWKNARLSDVCIGTSAAPTYFSPHNFVTKYADGSRHIFDLTDGGVAANNPVVFRSDTDRHVRAECSKDASTHESLDSAKRSDDNTHSSAKEPSPKQLKGSSISELCGRVFFDIIKSNKYSELCGLVLKNFGVVNANQVWDLNAMNLKMNNEDYETSPMLYLKDTQLIFSIFFKFILIYPSLSVNS
ncbi:patatin-like protein [Tanacetum coccineum]